MQQDLDIDLPTRATIAAAVAPDGRLALRRAYDAVRERSAALTEGLAAEDQVLQSMPDCSPTKWHLAHTSWFFENFLLKVHAPHYRPFDEAFTYLFNSYYQ